MGCGASSDKGREIKSHSAQSDPFFPPHSPEQQSRSTENFAAGATTVGSGPHNQSHKKVNQEDPVNTSVSQSSQVVSKSPNEAHQPKELPSHTPPPLTASSPADSNAPSSPSKLSPKKKKPAYVPPAPITAASAGKEDTAERSPGAGAGEKQAKAAKDHPNDEESLEPNDFGEKDTKKHTTRKEHNGDLTLGDHLDQNAISSIPTESDQQSEKLATDTHKNQNKSGGKSDSSDTDMKKPYIYKYPDDSPEPNSGSGMRFDELYRLKGVLGTGAFSTVREGFHRSNSEISYAVKCINRKKLSEEDEAALLDEVSILKEMKHPHIIRLFDFFTEASTYYLVMERMRGGELFDRIVAKAYYNEKEARDTCKIILMAVEYCHTHHVAHRDLKPENLLLLSDVDDSAVKIADFGFAKKVYEPNSLTTQCGTPGYVAPEILEGTAYDERADMWSVGVILYILLGGYPPFIESTQRDLFRKIRRGEYEFHEEYWGTVSRDAKTLISSLLTVSASDRLTAQQAMENPWILGDDSKLASRDLGGNLEKLRNFNAKRKFRAAVSVIMATNKLNLMGKEFFSSLKDGENPE